MKIKKAKAGFTIIELLVVVIILAILAGFAIAAYQDYIKQPYDLWLKLELGEQSKFLELAHAVDGGYHQWIGLMGYRPSKGKVLGNVGFYSGDSPCCDIYGTVSVTNSSCNDDGFEYFKCSDDGTSSNWHTISDICAAESLSCDTSQRGSAIQSQGQTLSASGVSGTVSSECNFAINSKHIGVCNCDEYILMAVTSYGEEYDDSNANIAGGDTLMTLNHKGNLCKNEGTDFKPYWDSKLKEAIGDLNLELKK